MGQKAIHSIIIVDDDKDDREIIRDAFLDNKHAQNYIFMESGQQLITYLTNSKTENQNILILLDLNMPGKDGKDVLKEMKKNDALKLFPVIVITTSSADMDRKMSYDLGANCFVTKPNSYKEFMEITDSIAKLWF